MNNGDIWKNHYNWKSFLRYGLLPGLLMAFVFWGSILLSGILSPKK